ncbi:MAG: hypothetical protein K1X75_16355 [Leptospirales bacterium]|nr:hypothetical protein [Leptospirales bacterium]
MQDRYAGDIGDFTKFYLIKRIQRILDYQDGDFGLNWYLNDRPERNGDGHKTSFLADPFHIQLDAQLVSDLNTTLLNRRVSTLEDTVRLPSKAVYFSDPVPSEPSSRHAWHQIALKKLAGVKAVLLDPDNGLQPPSAQGSKLPKYVVSHEIQDYVHRNELTIVYQHFSRQPRDQRLGAINRFLQASISGHFQHCVVYRAARYYVLIGRDPKLLTSIH